MLPLRELQHATRSSSYDEAIDDESPWQWEAPVGPRDIDSFRIQDETAV